MPEAFDCRATAAVLKTGNGLALAGHAATLMTVLSTSNGAWLKACAVLVWCVIVYLAIRVQLDSRFFELLASHKAEELDQWLQAAQLRKDNPPGTIAERRRRALRLWKALVIALVIEIGLTLLGLIRWLP